MTGSPFLSYFMDARDSHDSEYATLATYKYTFQK